MRDSDFRMELKHLLGDARFRSIRQHCLVYENLRKRGFVAIPWPLHGGNLTYGPC